MIRYIVLTVLGFWVAGSSHANDLVHSTKHVKSYYSQKNLDCAYAKRLLVLTSKEFYLDQELCKAELIVTFADETPVKYEYKYKKVESSEWEKNSKSGGFIFFNSYTYGLQDIGFVLQENGLKRTYRNGQMGPDIFIVNWGGQSHFEFGLSNNDEEEDEDPIDDNEFKKLESQALVVQTAVSLWSISLRHPNYAGLVAVHQASAKLSQKVKVAVESLNGDYGRTAVEEALKNQDRAFLEAMDAIVSVENSTRTKDESDAWKELALRHKKLMKLAEL